ncbi:acetylglucosamine-6-sulfatase [Sphingobacterium sp. Ag1]|uniref:sulfatase family protein n=1 Tax=Sphingobacterium sp. Ag1 TaxID=1643451 RepID=UPI000627FE80|nr:sulfatase [Sphingobacterium sp. Ag1]KKO89219.1 acetylglucosamine-6-sulfatase [Sphingobacterium sp. Ag1]
MKTPLNILSLLYCILAGAVPLLGQAQKSNLHQRPNIVFILTDDFTAQAWGVYGGIFRDIIKNPNIEQMAREGALLNNVFCTNSICTPSRATILTGQYSNKNQVYTLEDALDPEKENIAKDLQKAGYQTAIFGKWHLKKMPSGFDDFEVLPGHGQYHNPSYLSKDNWNDDEKPGKSYEGYVDDITTAMSLEWIKKRDIDRPFFLMCHFKATHEPFDFADRFKDYYKDVEFPYPPTFLDSGARTTGRSFDGQPLEELGHRYEQASTGSFWTTYPELPFSTEGLNALDARKKIYQKFIKDYLRCVAGIDDNLGKILRYLKSANLDENTVVILTSDQGYFLGEHNFMDKRLMYEESLRMPFVIRYPREIQGNSTVHDMVLNIDFAALFADYAGIKKPAYIQGKSFRSNLLGSAPRGWRSAMYYRYWQHAPKRPAHFGVRDERYKLIYFYGQPLEMTGTDKKPTDPAWEFYDLQRDPRETHNAIHDKQYSDEIVRLKKKLARLKAEAEDDDQKRSEFQHMLIKENLSAH